MRLISRGACTDEAAMCPEYTPSFLARGSAGALVSRFLPGFDLNGYISLK